MVIRNEQDLPQHYRTTWLKAVSALRLGNAGYTIFLMRTLLKEHPEFLAGRRLLRKAAIEKSSMQKRSFKKVFYSLFLIVKAKSFFTKKPYVALEVLEKVLEYDPYNTEANRLLHGVALACHMSETAGFALETLLEGQPKDIKVMHQLAEHYVQQNQLQKAGKIYNKILEINPSDLVAMRASKDTAAQVSMQSGGWDREGATYRELVVLQQRGENEETETIPK